MRARNVVRRRLLVALALLVCAFTAAVALAATDKSWRPAKTLDSAPLDSTPDVAVDNDGNATTAWIQTTDDVSRILARTRQAGGDWENPAVDLDPGAAVEPRKALLAVAPNRTV